MSGIINLIKNLVGGIFGFLGGLFGKKTPAIEGVSNPASKKSNSGYFLELDDSKSAKPSIESPSAAAIVSSENGTAPTQPKKTSRKEQLEAAKAANGKPASTPAAKAPAKPASVPVTVASAPATEVGYATKYPLPVSSGGRRLPGANMNSYLNMARQMK